MTNYNNKKDAEKLIHLVDEYKNIISYYYNSGYCFTLSKTLSNDKLELLEVKINLLEQSIDVGLFNQIEDDYIYREFFIFRNNVLNNTQDYFVKNTLKNVIYTGGF